MSLHPKIRFYNRQNIDSLLRSKALEDDYRFTLQVVSRVLPFRVNNYVVEELIDWEMVPEDPIFQLTFLQKGMLKPKHFNTIAEAIRRGANDEVIRRLANRIRLDLNPHPAGQMNENTAECDGQLVPGLQHKYRETCLIFPSQGQTCHSYCTFCFRWPQFVKMPGVQFATDAAATFLSYLRTHKEVTDVLLTGGDPLVMNVRRLSAYLEPLLGPGYEHIQNIRIGTKSVAYWPYRFISDPDSHEILELFERLVSHGKHLALMAHYNHWRELSTSAAVEAVRRVRNTGAEIRTQSPLIRHVNDDSGVWRRLWEEQVRLGCIPYYMFVERNTGAQHYFSVPLSRALEIYRDAVQQISGLGRTVRGPSMSARPGKICVEGVTEIRGEKVFVLTFLQCREPEYVKRPFFAEFDRNATWWTQLRPAFGESRFFFETFDPQPESGPGMRSARFRDPNSIGRQ